MKIKCEYCDTYIDDTNSNCPNCGAPCSGVKRAVSNQPMTIAELQQWYTDRNLPSPEVTRFFIGTNYRGPRAFGIYKEENSNLFVVYKNKADGERAVRYRGTDEAYAVNEIFQRLKQEILQQKAAKQTRSAPTTKSQPVQNQPQQTKKSRRSLGCTGIGCLVAVGIFITMCIVGAIAILIENEPSAGYYRFNDSIYYYLDGDAAQGSGVQDSWFQYDRDAMQWNTLWHEDQGKEEKDRLAVPEDLHKNKHAKAYYLQEEWNDSLDCTDIENSVAYKDIISNYQVQTGYYSYDNATYYHLDPYCDDGWFYYSTDEDTWCELEPALVPEDLTHNATADYYHVDGWDSSTQATDFEETSYYTDYYDYDTDSSSTWYDDDDDDYTWSYDDDDDDWDSGSDWDSGWDSGSSDWDSDW